MKAFMGSMGINQEIASAMVDAASKKYPEVLPVVGTVCLVKSIHKFSAVDGQPIVCKVIKDVYWDVRFEPARPVMMMEILSGPHKGHQGQVTINENVAWLK